MSVSQDTGVLAVAITALMVANQLLNMFRGRRKDTTLKEGMNSLNHSLREYITDKFNDHTGRVSLQFAVITERFDNIDTKFENVSVEIKGLEDRVEKRLDKTELEISMIQKRELDRAEFHLHKRKED